MDLLTGVPRVIFLAGEYACIEGGAGRHCAQRTGAVLTPDGYQGQVDPETLKSLLRRLDGEPDPLGDRRRFAVGSDDVGPADKPALSTKGEERSLSILEEDIREELLDQRGIGSATRAVPPTTNTTSEPPPEQGREPPVGETPTFPNDNPTVGIPPIFPTTPTNPDTPTQRPTNQGSVAVPPTANPNNRI